jgi:RNA polymerase sigma-70 factor (ECF subfamily)
MDEPALIKSAIEGDLDAFNRLVLEYQQLAFNLAYRMLNDEDSAEDITQTAFISAYRNLKSYRGGSFRGWLLRMVTNACYDELRRKHRHPTQSLEPVSEQDQQEVESPVWMEDENSPNPQLDLETAELDHAIQHCLDHLPEDFRAVVVMVDIEGLDYEEVALSVKSPLGTIKSRLARARLKLRDCLHGFGELLPDRYRLSDEEML